jgi:hypothetical protein
VKIPPGLLNSDLDRIWNEACGYRGLLGWTYANRSESLRAQIVRSVMRQVESRTIQACQAANEQKK